MKLYGLEWPTDHWCMGWEPEDLCDACSIRLANAMHMRTMDHYLTECCIPYNGLSCLGAYYPEYTDFS